MPRPIKERIITKQPRVRKFSPRGVRGRPDSVILGPDGLEAIRYADLEDLDHREAASRMGISRQTFERVLKKARARTADGLVNGKIITISEKKG